MTLDMFSELKLRYSSRGSSSQLKAKRQRLIDRRHLGLSDFRTFGLRSFAEASCEGRPDF